MSTEYADASARIRDALAAYAHALDDGRTDDIVALFTEDAVATLPGIPRLEGKDAIRAAYAEMVPGQPQRHVVTNTHVAEYDGTRATVVSDLVFLLKGEAGWAVRFVGRYTDRLQADGDRWLFESRDLVLS